MMSLPADITRARTEIMMSSLPAGTTHARLREITASSPADTMRVREEHIRRWAAGITRVRQDCMLS